ncbi:MAG TPA: hypothetical protein VIF09_23175 [Polyangiaceae bacterium]|jgi:hypothetical protein
MPVNPLASRLPSGLLAILVMVTAAGSVRAAEPTSVQCASAYEAVQISRQQGKLLSARDLASTCMRASCPEVARQDCVRWSDELAHEIPSVVVVARDPTDSDVAGWRLLVDGVRHAEIDAGRALELDPGAHVVRAEGPGGQTVEQSFTLYQGERDRLLRVAVRSPEPRREVSPSPALVFGPQPPGARPPRRSLVPPFVVGAVSLAAFGASVFLGLTGRQELSTLRTTCAPGCTDAQVNPVRTRLAASDVLLGVGIVGAAVAVTLLALRGTF